MTNLLRWVRSIFRVHESETEEARQRVDRDRARMEKQAQRIEQGASELQHRVYEVNHITEAIAQVWRRR